MKYDQRTPCPDCPFLEPNAQSYGIERLDQFASGEFPCHKTAELVDNNATGESEFAADSASQHCAGALIYLEKRRRSHQMMRIAERLGMYDWRNLNMEAPVA